MQTYIVLRFGNGDYLFQLGLEQIKEIERQCNAGIGAIYARVLAGRFGLEVDQIMPTEAQYRFTELLEVIRQGLIGGGEGVVDGADVKVSPVRATDLINTYLIAPDTRVAVREAWKLAAVILSALIEGYAPPKKAEPGESPATPTKSSNGRRSSPTASS